MGLPIPPFNCVGHMQVCFGVRYRHHEPKNHSCGVGMHNELRTQSKL